MVMREDLLSVCQDWNDRNKKDHEYHDRLFGHLTCFSYQWAVNPSRMALAAW